MTYDLLILEAGAWRRIGTVSADSLGQAVTTARGFYAEPNARRSGAQFRGKGGEQYQVCERHAVPALPAALSPARGSYRRG